MHAGGRRFDPVWLHHFCLLLLHGKSLQMKGFISFEDFLLFNNLEISDVLSGSTLDTVFCVVDSYQVSHLHMSYDTVRLHDRTGKQVKL